MPMSWNMTEGYIKLYRKSIDNGWIKNHNVWIFWTWCLLKATHKEYKQIVGFQEVTLLPGQFIFGLKAAALETALSVQSIRTVIRFLVIAENLTIKPTNKFSIITINNWHTYQEREEENNNQSNTQLTRSQHATNTQLTTNKNEKNVKNVKNKNIHTPLPADFSLSENVKKWAAAKNYDHLEEHLEAFILTCQAKEYKYANWDAALMRAIRDNWARIGVDNNGNGNARTYTGRKDHRTQQEREIDAEADRINAEYYRNHPEERPNG